MAYGSEQRGSFCKARHWFTVPGEVRNRAPMCMRGCDVPNPTFTEEQRENWEAEIDYFRRKGSKRADWMQEYLDRYDELTR